MTRNAHVSKINPHLPHDSIEIAGTPPPDARDDETARRNAERIIRDMLSDQADQGNTRAPDRVRVRATQGRPVA